MGVVLGTESDEGPPPETPFQRVDGSTVFGASVILGALAVLVVLGWLVDHGLGRLRSALERRDWGHLLVLERETTTEIMVFGLFSFTLVLASSKEVLRGVFSESEKGLKRAEELVELVEFLHVWLMMVVLLRVLSTLLALAFMGVATKKWRKWNLPHGPHSRLAPNALLKLAESRDGCCCAPRRFVFGLPHRVLYEVAATEFDALHPVIVRARGSVAAAAAAAAAVAAPREGAPSTAAAAAMRSAPASVVRAEEALRRSGIGIEHIARARTLHEALRGTHHQLMGRAVTGGGWLLALLFPVLIAAKLDADALALAAEGTLAPWIPAWTGYLAFPFPLALMFGIALPLGAVSWLVHFCFGRRTEKHVVQSGLERLLGDQAPSARRRRLLARQRAASARQRQQRRRTAADDYDDDDEDEDDSDALAQPLRPAHAPPFVAAAATTSSALSSSSSSAAATAATAAAGGRRSLDDVIRLALAEDHKSRISPRGLMWSLTFLRAVIYLSGVLMATLIMVYAYVLWTPAVTGGVTKTLSTGAAQVVVFVVALYPVVELLTNFGLSLPKLCLLANLQATRVAAIHAVAILREQEAQAENADFDDGLGTAP